MDYQENSKREKKAIFPVIGALILVVGSVGYIIFRVMSDRAYNKKWKDYDECGLA